jgi:hypothetical protein
VGICEHEDLGMAAKSMMYAVVRTSDSMNAQEVANTFGAFAKMGTDLGEAQKPLMHAVVRVCDSMNAQSVAHVVGFCQDGNRAW